MKKILVLFIAIFTTAIFAEEPAFSAPTPVEKMETSKENSGLDKQERENWDRLRKERREAREQFINEMRQKGKEMKEERRNNKNALKDSNKGHENKKNHKK